MQQAWLKFWRDMFTGRDNRTYDIGRVLWFQSVQAFILISLYALYKGGTFDPILWGAGLSALIAGGGAGLAMKGSTEPVVQDPSATPGPTPSYLDAITAASDAAVKLKQNRQSIRQADSDQNQ